LIGIRKAAIIGFLRGETIYPAILENLSQEGINVFVKV
jgi:hypothetical protein